MIASKLAPAEDDYEEYILSLNLESIRAIASLRHSDLYLSEDSIPSDMIQIAIRTLQLDSITPEEQALGFFTRKKLRKLATWPEWQHGEFKQLNQFHEQELYGKPVDQAYLPEGSIVLRPHWQYVVKRSGTEGHANVVTDRRMLLLNYMLLLRHGHHASNYRYNGY